MTPNQHTTPMPAPAELNAQLALAHAMPAGRAREQRITELVLGAMVAEIARCAPSARYAVFDWAAYGGLDLHYCLDGAGAEVSLTALAGEFAQWSSDLRAPDLAAMIPITSHGPFLLDLHTTARVSATPGEAAPERDAPQPLSLPTPARNDTPPRDEGAPIGPGPLMAHGLECPIRVGQEVTFADDPGQRGTVRAVYFHRGIIRCTIWAPGPVTVHPWDLLPVDGASEQWHERMGTLHTLQRAHASDLVCRRGLAVAEQAEALSRKLTALAITLRQYKIPDIDEGNTTESAARDFDEELEDLRALHTDLTDGDLIHAD